MAESGNKYILREFNDEDYEQYCYWWGDEKPPPRSSLPNIGLVCGDMKAIGFLAMTDCDFSIITWWCANPLNKERESHMAIKTIIKGLCDTSALINKSKVFCYTSNRGMIRMLESFNFINHDGHLIVELK